SARRGGWRACAGRRGGSTRGASTGAWLAATRRASRVADRARTDRSKRRRRRVLPGGVSATQLTGCWTLRTVRARLNRRRWLVPSARGWVVRDDSAASPHRRLAALSSRARDHRPRPTPTPP